MPALSPFKRRMFDIQGYEDVADDVLQPVARWMKLPFFICASICALAMILESKALLWILTALAIGGAASTPITPPSSCGA